MTAERVASPWWRTAPNPACASWCKEEHPPGEYARGGAMLCVYVVARTTAYSVEVQSCAATSHDDTALAYDPASVAVLIYPDEYLTPAQCTALAAALTTADQMAEATVR